MKRLVLFDFFDQKKATSHLSFLLLAFVVSMAFWFRNRLKMEPADLISVFFMIFIQVEVFIFFGNALFKNGNFDKNPGAVTRFVISRFIVFLALCLGASMVIYLALRFVTGLFTIAEVSDIIPDFFRNEWHEWFRSTIKGLALGALIFVILLWQTSLRKEQKLREENLIFQNETLKSQVNPHFLFNSLNTVSSFIQTNPEKAEQFIHDLSSVYRYILENGQKDRVPLKTELELLSCYYDLQRVRDDEKISLTVEWTGAADFSIIPVSLQILLENAIKHNKATRESPLKIEVYIEDQSVVVRNNLQRKAIQLHSTGVGLKNLRERIRLSMGKELVVEETNEHFTVKIPLFS